MSLFNVIMATMLANEAPLVSSNPITLTPEQHDAMQHPSNPSSQSISASVITSSTLNQAACVIQEMRVYAGQIRVGDEDQVAAWTAAEEVAHTELQNVVRLLNAAINIEQTKMLQRLLYPSI